MNVEREREGKSRQTPGNEKDGGEDLQLCARGFVFGVWCYGTSSHSHGWYSQNAENIKCSKKIQ